MSIMGTATYIQSETEFDSLIASEGLVVVDFTAQWCGPCKLVAPRMDRLASDYADRLQVFKLDLDANKGLAKRLGIRSIPAVMMFRKGELLETLVGVKEYEEYTKTVDQYLT
jgi:thioredoxin 1